MSKIQRLLIDTTNEPPHSPDAHILRLASQEQNTGIGPCRALLTCLGCGQLIPPRSLSFQGISVATSMKRKHHDEPGCQSSPFHVLPSDFGLTEHDVVTLARKLGVSQQMVLPETLAYATQCKLDRGTMCAPDSIVEIWDSLRDKENPSSRILVLGVNSRKPDCLTRATQELPHVTRLLTSYVRHCAPGLFFNVL